jgi:hypothetical protein
LTCHLARRRARTLLVAAVAAALALPTAASADSRHDSDHDGLPNRYELKRSHTSPKRADTDRDTLSDGREVLRTHTNPLKRDSDGDGLSDAREVRARSAATDTDRDGLSDRYETRTSRTDPKKADTDGDGLSDGYEVNTSKTNPLKTDSDGDGLSDGYEVNTSKTNPLKTDSDGDGLSDGYEVNTSKTSPLKPDTDADGLSDGYEVTVSKSDPKKSDSDADGLTDAYEVNTSKTNPAKADSDADGLSDGYEVNTSKTKALTADTDGDGLSDGYEVNTSKTKPLTADTDGDGLSDGYEVNTSKTNPLKADTDGDGLSDGYEVNTSKTNPLDPASPPRSDTTAPSVSLTAPAGGSTVSGSVAVSAGASDAGGVSGVQFRLDGQPLGSRDTTSPYSVQWDTTSVADGAHALTAVATDVAGNTATSAAVNVTVKNVRSAPVAAYSFDAGSGATVADRSGLGNSGSIAGATWTSSGRFGGALSFDGVDDWVTVADSSSLDLQNGMTLEAWVKPVSTDGFQAALIKEGGTDLAYGMYATSAYGSMVATPRPSSWMGGNVDLGATQGLQANTWTHVATTYDRSMWRLYVNGTEVASRPLTTAIPVSSGPLRIGGDAVWPEQFKGLIDEVRVYERALPLVEILADRDKGVEGGTPPDTTAPDTSLTSGPSGTVSVNSASFGFSSSESGSTYQCRLDAAAWGACSSPKAYSGLANGTHTFDVRATDAAGHTDASPASRTWTVNVASPADTTAPDTSITGGPTGTVSSTAASFDFASSESGSTYQCRLDAGAWGACSSPKAYSGLANGTHTFDVRATDAAGNTDASPASRTWTVSTTSGGGGACTQTLSPGANVASAVSSAASGAVICLNSGSYGSVNFFDMARSGFVTLRSASGTGASLSPQIGNSDYIKFQSLTIAGTLVNNCSTHVHFLDSTFTKGLLVTNNGSTCPSGSQDIVVDGSTFDNVGQATYEGRLNFVAVDGGTIRNSTFSGIGSQASDGIQFLGGTKNSLISGNHFTGIKESLCGSVHCDAVQFYGAGANNTIDGNHFEQGDTFIMAPDGTSTVTVTDNVFDGSGVSYADKIQFGSASSPVFRHNTVRDVRVSFDSKTGSSASTNLVARDNIMIGSSSFKTTNGSGCSGCTISSNLFDDSGSATGSGNLIGMPTFSGGSSPASYTGYKLATSSIGRSAATDGADMGAIIP